MLIAPIIYQSKWPLWPSKSPYISSMYTISMYTISCIFISVDMTCFHQPCSVNYLYDQTTSYYPPLSVIVEKESKEDNVTTLTCYMVEIVKLCIFSQKVWFFKCNSKKEDIETAPQNFAHLFIIPKGMETQMCFAVRRKNLISGHPKLCFIHSNVYTAIHAGHLK